MSLCIWREPGYIKSIFFIYGFPFARLFSSVKTAIVSFYIAFPKVLKIFIFFFFGGFYWELSVINAIVFLASTGFLETFFILFYFFQKIQKERKKKWCAQFVVDFMNWRLCLQCWRRSVKAKGRVGFFVFLARVCTHFGIKLNGGKKI